MAQTAKNDEDMPYFMETENTWEEIEDLGRVNHCSKSEKQSTHYQPYQGAGGHRCKHWLDRYQAQPAHEQINTSVHPPRDINNKHLHHNPYSGYSPNNRQQPPTIKPAEVVQTNGCIGAGDQQVDRRMVELPQPQSYRLAGFDQVISGACRKHYD